MKSLFCRRVGRAGHTALITAGVFLFSGWLSGQVSGPQPAQQEQETREKIQDLMRKALESDDAAKQSGYYKEILILNPDNQAAGLGLRAAEDKLQAEKTQKEAAAEKQKVEHERAQNAAKRKDLALKTGFEAIARDDLAPLKAALLVLDDALRIDGNDEQLTGLRTEIQSRIRTRNTLFWVYVGLAVALVASAALCLYFLLRVKKKVVVEVLEGPVAGEKFVVNGAIVRIGSMSKDDKGQIANDVIISDLAKKISRCHCEIRRHGRFYFITDKSKHGTFVNDHRVDTERSSQLRVGDRISLAGAATLVFRLQ